MEKNKEIKILKDLVLALEESLDIPKNHHLIAVFKDNNSDEIEGWLVVGNGVEGEYPMYSSEELLKKYGKN